MSVAEEPPAIDGPPVEGPRQAFCTQTWRRATAGDASAQEGWRASPGGAWSWQADGCRAIGDGTEWSSLACESNSVATFDRMRNLVIGVTVSGNAEVAGLSFGDFRDFLAEPDPHGRPSRLQLEVDAGAGCWAFRVDGRLQNRAWWDARVRGTDDLLQGPLTLKARHADEVTFRDLTVHAFDASCRLSVVMTCFRFLHRLRVTLKSWCHQELPSGALEVLVVNPDSPDGTHEHLAAVARSYPHVRVRELAVGDELVKNKGAMINRAVRASRGRWIWLTDADCLFPTGASATVLAHVEGRPRRLYYGERRFLSAVETDALIAGRLDPVRDFEAICRRTPPRHPERAPWGYTQIVPREVLEQHPYHEGFNHFAHSDGMFVEACRRRRLTPEPVSGLFCLHLDHPFSWYGTEMFL